MNGFDFIKWAIDAHPIATTVVFLVSWVSMWDAIGNWRHKR